MRCLVLIPTHDDQNVGDLQPEGTKPKSMMVIIFVEELRLLSHDC